MRLLIIAFCALVLIAGASSARAASSGTGSDVPLDPAAPLAGEASIPGDVGNETSSDVEKRINQTLKDAGAVLPEEIDVAYGAFQRGFFLTALAIAIEKAKEGDVPAQTLLGELLSRGLGIKQDQKEAAEWYKLAAEAGDDEAQYALGLMYLDGRGVEKDTSQAAAYFKQAAQSGNAVAQRELAYLLLKGEELERRPMLAAAYLRKAAGANDMDAQFALAGLFVEGVGVAQSDIEGARWYGEAAKNGHIPGQIEYAIMLFNGRGITKDEGRAAGWFGQAARAGNPVAQVRLARLLVEGRGVEKNAKEAAKWYLTASRSGIRDDFMEDWLLSLDADIRQSAEAEANVKAWPDTEDAPAEYPASSEANTELDNSNEPPSGKFVETITVPPPIGGLQQAAEPFDGSSASVEDDVNAEPPEQLPTPVDILEE